MISSAAAGPTVQAAVNSIRTARGNVRAVCECCGRKSKPHQPAKDGEPDLWRMPQGWSTSPLPADYLHKDGSRGSTFTCPSCNAHLRRGATLRLRAYMQGTRTVRLVSA